jgi:rhodanese-related sulfurtransferase
MPRLYQEIDAGEYARWQREGKSHCLLDVRESEELRAASIPGALHLPMDQLVQRVDEIPRDKTLVVMCHHGGRSATVAGFLSQMGFTDVYNLDGGIDAYARSVDPAIGRY